MASREVLVVGAGPAGLTAAWELVRMGWRVTVLERDAQYVGGLARTVRCKGLAFDIGAHQFFSKNRAIREWWHARLGNEFISLRRLTRILFRQHFIHYPLRARDVLFSLGLGTSAACLVSYAWRQWRPVRPEASFEDWVTNRFGDRLYGMFFRAYTEKVWGRKGRELSVEWASQRIKGLSFRRVVLDALGLRQDNLRTLAAEFEYPRFGAGALWEKTLAEILQAGAQVFLDRRVIRLERVGQRVKSVSSINGSGRVEQWPAEVFVVSMPLKDCVMNVEPPIEAAVREAAERLAYRDLVIVALRVNRAGLFPDNWVYVQEPGVKVARIENYANWTDGMALGPNASCVGMEYFCSKDDAFWRMSDAAIMDLAKREMEHLCLAQVADIPDGCVVRVEKAYPVYGMTFRKDLEIIRQGLAGLENLQMAGRGGLHRYNNQDDAMLTGMAAAGNVAGGHHDVWHVNADAGYLEEEVRCPASVALPRRR